jgi:hypothetical protein
MWVVGVAGVCRGCGLVLQTTAHFLAVGSAIDRFEISSRDSIQHF